MPTENPRVVTYPGAALYRRLKKYQQDRGIKSLSQAVSQALEEFFHEADLKEAESVYSDAFTAIHQELATVHARVDRLSEVVRRLEENSDPGSE